MKETMGPDRDASFSKFMAEDSLEGKAIFDVAIIHVDAFDFAIALQFFPSG